MVSDLKRWHRNLLIILLLPRVNFIKCEEYSFGQKTVAILGTLIWPNTVVSSVTVRRCWYRNDFHKPVARNNIRIREANVRGRLAWAQGKRY